MASKKIVYCWDHKENHSPDNRMHPDKLLTHDRFDKKNWEKWISHGTMDIPCDRGYIMYWADEDSLV